jgi:hypothetical protein
MWAVWRLPIVLLLLLLLLLLCCEAVLPQLQCCCCIHALQEGRLLQGFTHTLQGSGAKTGAAQKRQPARVCAHCNPKKVREGMGGLHVQHSRIMWVVLLTE